MELIILNEEGTYKDIDSWGDLISECNYRLIKIVETKSDFKLKLTDGTLLNEICLSNLQMKNLKEFLEKQIVEKSNLSYIQCSEFCNFINDIEDFKQYKKTKINMKSIIEIGIGESLLICEVDNKKNNFLLEKNIYIKKPFFHFAINIGKGLFISKFGKGNIYITSFEELHKIYNYKNFYILKN